MYTPYSDEITQEEIELGFQRREVRNPRAEFAGNPERVQAVLFPISTSERIIKLNTPEEGKHSYKHQRYGYFGTKVDDNPEWLPVGAVAYPNASMAVKYVTSGHAEQVENNSGMAMSITIVDPGENY